MSPAEPRHAAGKVLAPITEREGANVLAFSASAGLSLQVCTDPRAPQQLTG